MTSTALFTEAIAALGNGVAYLIGIRLPGGQVPLSDTAPAWTDLSAGVNNALYTQAQADTYPNQYEWFGGARFSVVTGVPAIPAGSVEGFPGLMARVTSLEDRAGLDVEVVQDTVAAMIQAGMNITKTYDDTAGTLTISASGSGSGGGGGGTDLTTLPGYVAGDGGLRLRPRLDGLGVEWYAETLFGPSGPRSLTDVALWLKADALALADGASVATWTDSSGKGRTFTQATAGSQPVLKTAQIGGKPVVRFDGGNDFLSSAAFAPTTGQAITIVMVGRSTQGALGIGLEASVNFNATNGAYVLYREASGALTGGARVISGGSPISSAPISGTFAVVYRLDFALGTSMLRLTTNGVAQTTSATYADPSQMIANQIHYLGMRGGTTLPFEGDIAEVMILNRALTDAEVLDLNTIYLKPKYSLTY